MPEGPSIVILKEDAATFVGRVVERVEGDGKQDVQRMRGRKIVALRSWGKHFLVVFEGFSLRIHLMLSGSYRINEAGRPVPQLGLQFTGGDRLDFYSCSVKFIEGRIGDAYDWTADIMSPSWDPKTAGDKLLAKPDRLVADALLDQAIFAGVGNIIKNEVLHRIRVHPESAVGALPPRKFDELVSQPREYGFDFYRWKRNHELPEHYQVHTRTSCPRDATALVHQKQLGRSKRRAFYCPACQCRYSGSASSAQYTLDV